MLALPTLFSWYCKHIINKFLTEFPCKASVLFFCLFVFSWGGGSENEPKGGPSRKRLGNTAVVVVVYALLLAS